MEIFFNNIDVREELELFLDQNKIKVFYIRNDRSTRCKCFDQLHKDGNSNCINCGGSGFLSSIKLVEVFGSPTSSDDMLKMSGEKRTELGDANLISKAFYFDHKTKPNAGDRVLIVGFDKKGLPTEVKETYTLNLVREIRGYKGRIEYYKVLCRNSPQSLKLEQTRLNKVPNNHKLKLMKGVRYQWGS